MGELVRPDFRNSHAANRKPSFSHTIARLLPKCMPSATRPKSKNMGKSRFPKPREKCDEQTCFAIAVCRSDRPLDQRMPALPRLTWKRESQLRRKVCHGRLRHT